MQSFRSLKVWEKSHYLTLGVYKVTKNFPTEERYGLSSQMRRASASIAANIAEGCGRRGNPELIHFLHLASGSASELEYHLMLARDLEILGAAEYEELSHGVVDVKRMLVALVHKLRSAERTD